MKHETIAEQLTRIQKWQVTEMGNTCSICYGNNAQVKCEACGWWGKVPPPKTKSKIKPRKKNS